MKNPVETELDDTEILLVSHLGLCISMFSPETYWKLLIKNRHILKAKSGKLYCMQISLNTWEVNANLLLLAVVMKTKKTERKN